MAFTKVSPAGIGSTPGDGYRIGDSFLHSTGVEITNINATGIVTAASLDISGAIDFDGQTNLDHVSIAGVTTASDDIKIVDNKRLLFGNSSDMLMYHLGGANSYIVNTANNLYIHSNNAVEIGSVDTNGSNVETSARFIRNGAVELYHNDLKRLETSSVGVSIPQDLTVDGHTNLDNVSIVGITTITNVDALRLNHASGCYQTFSYNGTARGYVGTGNHMYTGGSTGDFGFAGGSSANIVFATANNERLRITNSGQVNIGGDYTQTSYATQITGDLLVQKTASAYLNPNIDIYNYVNSGYAGAITFSGKIGGSKYSQARIRAYGGSNTSDGALAIETGNMGEKLRIDSSGRIGINNSNPDQRVKIGGNVELNAYDNANGGGGYYTAKGLIIGNAYDAGISGLTDDRNAIIWQERGLDLDIGTNNTLRMKFLYDGDIFLGSASVAGVHGSTGGKRGLVYDSDGGVGNHPFLSVQHGSRSSGNPRYIGFQATHVEEGSIRQSNGGYEVSYNNNSDYRLKENVVDISDGITRLKTLKPKRYNWIGDESNTLTDGFLAHEVMTSVPQAITGTKDEVDENNNPVYQQIDQSKLIPLLTAALKEAVTKIETLEAKVAALEGS